MSRLSRPCPSLFPRPLTPDTPEPRPGVIDLRIDRERKKRSHSGALFLFSTRCHPRALGRSEEGARGTRV